MWALRHPEVCIWASFSAAIATRERALLPSRPSLTGLRSLHRQATQYHRLPSEVLGIADPWVAWAVNEACDLAGSLRPKGDD
jgi:hypothetical protein